MKYFKLGQQQFSGQAVYGLYQQTLDCFLVIDDRLDLLKKLKYLLSSRYTTVIVCISSAENYSPTIIDNVVCDRWTLSNRTDFSFKDNFHNGFSYLPVIAVTHLVEKISPVDWDTTKEKQWIQMCMFYLLFLETQTNKHYGELDVELSGYLPLDGLGDYLPLADMKQIMRILYFGKDFDSADQEILEIIKKYKGWFEFYQLSYNNQ